MRSANTMMLHCFFLTGTLAAQEPSKFPPMEESNIRRITADWISEPMKIDGKLDEVAWQSAKRRRALWI
jgi:hypothetical protein